MLLIVSKGILEHSYIFFNCLNALSVLHVPMPCICHLMRRRQKLRKLYCFNGNHLKITISPKTVSFLIYIMRSLICFFMRLYYIASCLLALHALTNIKRHIPFNVLSILFSLTNVEHVDTPSMSYIIETAMNQLNVIQKTKTQNMFSINLV